MGNYNHKTEFSTRGCQNSHGISRSKVGKLINGKKVNMESINNEIASYAAE